MIPAESAHDTIGALGEVGLLQFKDLNADKSAFQRTYANQVGLLEGVIVPRRCHVCCPGSSGLTGLKNRRCCFYDLPTQVKRCDEMARKIRYFHEQVSTWRWWQALEQCFGAALVVAPPRR